jgi:hypothetical protein
VILSKEHLAELTRASAMECPWIRSTPSVLPLDAVEWREFEKLIDTIPVSLRRVFEQRVRGWVLVRDLGSPASLFFLSDGAAVTYDGIIYVDVATLRQSYDEFLAAKENSLYRGGAYRIKVQEKLPVPTALVAFVSRAAYIFAYRNVFVQNTNVDTDSAEELDWYPFSRIDWEWDGGTSLQGRSAALREWGRIRKYYATEEVDKFPNDLLQKHFLDWQTSGFTSPAATQTTETDWAEAFAQKYVADQHKTDITFVLAKDGKEVSRRGFCPQGNPCRRKLALINVFFEHHDLLRLTSKP